MGRIKEMLCNYTFIDNYITIVSYSDLAPMEVAAYSLIGYNYMYILVNEQYMLWTIDLVQQYLCVNSLDQLPKCIDYLKTEDMDYFPIFVVNLADATEYVNRINNLHVLAEHQFI